MGKRTNPSIKETAKYHRAVLLIHDISASPILTDDDGGNWDAQELFNALENAGYEWDGCLWVPSELNYTEN